MYEADVAEALRIYRERPGSERDRRIQIDTDHGFAVPARELAIAHAAAGNNVYHYEFAWRSRALDGRIGAAHVVDMPFFWGNLSAPGVSDLLGRDAVNDPATVRLSDALFATLARFVATGAPDGGELGPWPRFTPAVRNTLIIDVEPKAVVDHNADRWDFWAARLQSSAAPLSRLAVKR